VTWQQRAPELPALRRSSMAARTHTLSAASAAARLASRTASAGGRRAASTLQARRRDRCRLTVCTTSAQVFDASWGHPDAGQRTGARCVGARDACLCRGPQKRWTCVMLRSWYCAPGKAPPLSEAGTGGRARRVLARVHAPGMRVPGGPRRGPRHAQLARRAARRPGRRRARSAGGQLRP